MPKRNVILFVATLLVGLVALAARERSGHAQRFGEVLGAIERGYFQPVTGERLFDAAVEGAVLAKMRIFRAPEFLGTAFLMAVLAMLVHLLLGG